MALAILRGLKNWSLSEALSEDGKASISRLLALLGFTVIISIYLGTGCGVIFRILDGGTVTDLGSLGTFLVGGAALFTRIANQIKEPLTGMVNRSGRPEWRTNRFRHCFQPQDRSEWASTKNKRKSGINLAPVQGAIYTLQNGAEHPLAATNISVLNSGAVELTP